MRGAVYAACAAAILATGGGARGAEETDPAGLVANPRGFVGRTVTITVRFGKINNVFRGWEAEANLKASTKIKFAAMPLAEIACYAEKNDRNAELLGGLRRGQEVTLTGHLKKFRLETKIKGERRTVKRSVKGSELYGFIVQRIEEIGEAPPGGPGGRMPRGRLMLQR
ncbi:MAG: hypothetical protein GXY35_11725 [Chlamydiae bacterium]|nr:hypothetical protein [Chlamydiota bacterium]